MLGRTLQHDWLPDSITQEPDWRKTPRCLIRAKACSGAVTFRWSDVSVPLKPYSAPSWWPKRLNHGVLPRSGITTITIKCVLQGWMEMDGPIAAQEGIACRNTMLPMLLFALWREAGSTLAGNSQPGTVRPSVEVQNRSDLGMMGSSLVPVLLAGWRLHSLTPLIPVW